VAHQAVGAALLGVLVAFTVLGWRDRAALREVVAQELGNKN
ncbi:MAG TPA: heme A synthase, partial [Cyanobacteria bacterium UBA11148]|nr:heme A synthase [Cyanobacteria bacterium UBA11148]